MLDLHYLQSQSLFGGIDDERLKHIMGMLEEARYAKGQDIVREGEDGSKLYFIYRGAVEVLKAASREQDAALKRIAVLQTGDTFGEMEMIDIQPRSATVRALEETVTLTLSYKDLYALSTWNLETFTLIVLNLARDMSRRLRRMDEIVAQYLQKNA